MELASLPDLAAVATRFVHINKGEEQARIVYFVKILVFRAEADITSSYTAIPLLKTWVPIVIPL